MDRCNIYSQPAEGDYVSEPELVGWFDRAKADRWTDADYNGNGSGGTGRGQAVCRTAGGKWVLENWSNWQGEANTYQYVTEAEARDWLLRNHEDGAVAGFFGEVPEEEDRRPGRPEVGGLVNVRLGDLVGQVDAYASENGIGSRAEAIRILLGVALAGGQPYTVTWRDYATGQREILSRHATLGAAVEALREQQAGDYEAQQERGMPSTQPRVEHDGRPVDVEAVQ